MLPGRSILPSVTSRWYRGKCIKMHRHTLETPLKASQIYFVLQCRQVSTISSIFIVQMTGRRLKVIYVGAYCQDIYIEFFEMMIYVDIDTGNAIKMLLSGNARKQKIGEIVKGALDRDCPTRSPGKVRWSQAPISHACTNSVPQKRLQSDGFPIALQESSHGRDIQVHL